MTTCALVTIAVLYVVAAALPFWGVWGLFRSAREDLGARERLVAERGIEHMTFDDLDASMLKWWGRPARVMKHARRDLWRIGLGLAAGCVASIWSLFV